MPASLFEEAQDSARHNVAQTQTTGLRVRPKLDHHVFGNFQRDRNPWSGNRHWPLDSLRFLKVSVSLPVRQTKFLGQHRSGIRQRVTPRQQIERRIQALSPFGMGGS